MASLSLDYGAQHISAPFAPMPDDQGIVNDVTVHRRDGSFARVEQETGPLSTQDPPDGVGRYATELTVDAETDGQLTGIASWIRSLGTLDAERYPRVHVNLARNPSKIADVMAVDSQDRMVIDNPPAWMPPEDIDLIIEGYTEEIGLYRWDWTANTSPGGIYSTVGVYGTDATVSRYDSAHSTLVSGVSDSATSLSVATVAGHALWVTGSSSPTFPFDIGVEGIRIQVDSISGATSPQTFTVVRNLDGIEKALSAGAQVRLWRPARWGL